VGRNTVRSKQNRERKKREERKEGDDEGGRVVISVDTESVEMI